MRETRETTCQEDCLNQLRKIRYTDWDSILLY
jgi:hypothetical protein